jgi:hypothetical protein
VERTQEDISEIRGKVAEITSRFHRRGHEEQKEFRRLRRFTQIRHSGVVIPSSFDIHPSAFSNHPCHPWLFCIDAAVQFLTCHKRAQPVTVGA